MRQLTTNRPATQHDEARRRCVERGELVPQCVAGDIADGIQPGQRRHEGPRAGGNDNAARGEALRAAIVELDLYRPGIDHRCIALQHLDAQRGVALHAVVRRDVGNHLVHARHHGAEAESRFACCEPILIRMAQSVGHAGRLDDGLARHAAIVEAVSAHLVGFDQGHLGLHRGGDVSRHQARGAAANHDQVAVELGGSGPLCIDATRLHDGQQLLCDKWEDTQQRKRGDQARRQDAGQTFQLCQLGARIHKYRRTGQHAQLADPVEPAHRQTGEPHQQIDQEEGEHRNQAQRKQVEPTLALYAFVHRFHARAEAAQHCVAEQVTRGKKG